MKNILYLSLIFILISCNNSKTKTKNIGYVVDIDYGEYEDSVVISIEKSSTRQDSNGMIPLVFQSEDLLYTIKVFPKLIEYLKPETKYKFTWKRYQIKKDETRMSDDKGTFDIHCWNNVVDSNGKEIILSGDDIMKKGESDPECLVDVSITSLNP